MCGRYVRRSDKQRIAEHFAVHGPSVPDFGMSWNVAPQTFQPIIRLNHDTGERDRCLMGSPKGLRRNDSELRHTFWVY